jgi:hypothetical protein
MDFSLREPVAVTAYTGTKMGVALWSRIIVLAIRSLSEL